MGCSSCSDETRANFAPGTMTRSMSPNAAVRHGALEQTHSLFESKPNMRMLAPIGGRAASSMAPQVLFVDHGGLQPVMSRTWLSTGYRPPAIGDMAVIANIVRVARSLDISSLPISFVRQLREMAATLYGRPSTVGPVPEFLPGYETQIDYLLQQMQRGQLTPLIDRLLHSLGGHQMNSTTPGEGILCRKETQGVGGGWTHGCTNITCNISRQALGFSYGLCMLAGPFNAPDHPGCTCVGIAPGGRRPPNLSFWEWILLVAIIVILIITPWPDEIVVAGYLARVRAAGLMAGGT